MCNEAKALGKRVRGLQGGMDIESAFSRVSEEAELLQKRRCRVCMTLTASLSSSLPPTVSSREVLAGEALLDRKPGARRGFTLSSTPVFIRVS